MKVYANDTFNLYLGVFIALIGFFFAIMSFMFLDFEERLFRFGIACIGLGISVQLMAFHRQPSDPE